MLGKLIKHDFKNTWMVMTFVCALIIIGGIIISLITLIPNKGQDVLNIFFGLLMLIYILGIPALGVFGIIYLISYYHKKLYSNQGYLSFTLPATNAKVALSKMIVAGIWIVLGHISVMASITMVAAAGLGKNFPTEFSDFTGRGLLNIAIIALSIPHLMSYFFSISVGQTRRKNKVAGAVICQFIIYFVCLVWLIVEMINYGEVSWNMTGLQVAQMITIKSIIYSIIMTLFFCGVSLRLVNKKLNLE